MGPADPPSRRHLTWDARTVPWSDGSDNQLPYAEAVRRWSAFHDKMAEYNSNKIAKSQRGIVLLSKLYG